MGLQFEALLLEMMHENSKQAFSPAGAKTNGKNPVLGRGGSSVGQGGQGECLVGERNRIRKRKKKISPSLPRTFLRP